MGSMALLSSGALREAIFRCFPAVEPPGFQIDLDLESQDCAKLWGNDVWSIDPLTRFIENGSCFSFLPREMITYYLPGIMVAVIDVLEGRSDSADEDSVILRFLG